MDTPIPAINTQRGVPYSPSAASKQRTEAMIAASRRERPRSKREQAQYLDQVEHAYRERRRSRPRSK